MKKLVMFDLDGTLVHSGLCGKEALDVSIEKLFGKKPNYTIELISGNTDTKNFALVFEHTLGRKIKPAQFKKLKETYLKTLPGVVSKAVKKKEYSVLKGAEKFLQLLSKQKDVCLALGTGNFQDSAFIKLAPSKLGKYFKTGGFGETGTDRAHMLENGVKNAEKFFKTKFKPEDVYVIGDTHKDVLAAKENGYHSAVILAGEGDKKKLLRAAAEVEVKDFTDVSTLLLWLDIKQDPKGVKRGNYILPASAIEHVFFSRTGIDEDRLKMFRIKKYGDLPTGKIF